MLAHLMIAAALLAQQSPEEADKTSQLMAGYARIERLANAAVRIEECSEWGYQSGTGVEGEVIDTWQRYLQPNSMTVEAAIGRFNAQKERVRSEAEEEQVQALTSRQAFEIFRRNVSQRCAALTFDRPNWLKGDAIDFVMATMGWDDLANERFGPEPDAAD